MTDSKYRGRRLDASQLFAILDDLAGITELQRQPINEKELDYCEPSPLPRAMLDRSLEKIRSMKAAEVEATPRRWWSRPAAALPIAISVFLLAAAPIYFFWSGRNSTKELTFEHAIETVFDAAVPMNRRHSAYGHIAVSIKVGISAIKKCAAEVPALEPDVNDALAEITAMCEQPAAVTPGNAFPSGHHRDILDTLREGREGDEPRQRAAIKDFLEMASSGIEAMWSARTLDGRFLQEFSIQFPMIQNRLNR